MKYVGKNIFLFFDNIILIFINKFCLDALKKRSVIRNNQTIKT